VAHSTIRAMNYGPPPPGPPAPPVAGQTSPPVASKTGGKLKWVILSVVLGILMLVGVFVAAVFMIVFGAMKSSEPYQHAVQVASHDPRVLERLGAPIKPGWLTGGTINVSGGSGAADLTISVEGSRGKGTIFVAARKSEGEWTYQNLALRIEDSRERIDLLRPSSVTPAEKR
jgi:hypothetical protein